MSERLLVLAVDIDNDLYRKTKITGPVIGRTNNLKAAQKLALADPQDTDANTMFEAVRKYDELKAKRNQVVLATITGAEKEGYAADAELSRQLDRVLDKTKVDACILVTDGASDGRVIPILKTRTKVNSVDIVRMKQAEMFENTYFTILEKLKEPHYARIVFGIPAVILLLFTLSYYFNFGWQLPVGLIGLYLVIKGFGIEDTLMNSFKGLGFSVDRLSFVFYAASIFFFLVSIIVSMGSYSSALAGGMGSLEVSAYTIEGFLLLLPVSLVLYVMGRVIDMEQRRLRYRALKQGTYVGYMIIVVVMLYLVSAWVIGQIYFWQLLAYSLIAIVFGYGISLFSGMLMKHAIKKSRMKGKRVINDIGASIGKVIDIDQKRGSMLIKTDYGNTITYDIDRISSVSDRIIVR